MSWNTNNKDSKDNNHNNHNKNYLDKIKHNQYTKDISSLNRSFSYAFKGLKFTIDNERNMRIHITAVIFVLQYAYIYGVSEVQFMALIMLFGVVMCAEMVNTALEALVNMSTESYNTFAKIAKDVAAGAVLISAIVSVIVGAIIFRDVDKIIESFNILHQNPFFLALFLFEIVIAYIFVFRWTERNKKI